MVNVNRELPQPEWENKVYGELIYGGSIASSMTNPDYQKPELYMGLNQHN